MVSCQLNPYFSDLSAEYIFPIIEEKVSQLPPAVRVVNLGIGDVALPLAPSICEAICKATHEMTTPIGIRGYGPSSGYPFLKTAIADVCYEKLIEPDEIFISDGINTDATNLLELFDLSCSVGIPNPTYPAYLSSAILSGRKGHIIPLPCTEETGFVPLPPQERLDVAYLCTPSNPTGVALTRTQLSLWVDYARTHNTILIIDNAYEAFVTSPDVPRSIYEIEGASDVAIELRSFSKSAGFTALRCAYATISRKILNGTLHGFWNKRQSIKSNGISYIIQKGAEAALSPQGLAETKAQVDRYRKEAHILRTGLTRLGCSFVGGVDAPYLWWKIPPHTTSWQFFDTLLTKCHLISVPGPGFGSLGEGFVRLSAFTTQAEEAVQNLCALS